jgi:hypothetical protein
MAKARCESGIVRRADFVLPSVILMYPPSDLRFVFLVDRFHLVDSHNLTLKQRRPAMVANTPLNTAFFRIRKNNKDFIIFL